MPVESRITFDTQLKISLQKLLITTCVHLLQGTYSSHGVELVMVTIEDQRIIATKLTVRQQVVDSHAPGLVSRLFSCRPYNFAMEESLVIVTFYTH